VNQADDRQPERLRFGGTGRGRSLEGREMLRMYRLKVWTVFLKAPQTFTEATFACIWGSTAPQLVITCLQVGTAKSNDHKCKARLMVAGYVGWFPGSRHHRGDRRGDHAGTIAIEVT